MLTEHYTHSRGSLLFTRNTRTSIRIILGDGTVTLLKMFLFLVFAFMLMLVHVSVVKIRLEALPQHLKAGRF